MPREEVSDEAMESINRVIFRSFVQQASSEGSILILAYLPVQDELPYPRSWTPVGLKILREAGLMYTDLTPCLSVALYSNGVAPADRWTRGGMAHIIHDVAMRQLRHAYARSSPQTLGIITNEPRSPESTKHRLV